MLFAMLIIGLIDNYVVVIAESISLWQFHATRSVLTMSLLALGVLAMGTRLRPRRWRPVLVRSALFAGSMIIYFGCLAFLPIAQVVAGLFTSPIIVVVLTAFVLKEPVGPIRWIAATVGFAGILVILGPGSEGFGLLSLLPLVAALFYALAAIATRRWCEGESVTTLLFWFFAIIGAASAVVLAYLTFAGGVAPEGPSGFLTRGLTWPSGAAWFWVVAQAVGSIVAVGSITRAYQIGEASYVAVFEYSLMIFAPVWAFMLFGEAITFSTALGVGLIIAAGSVIAWRTR